MSANQTPQIPARAPQPPARAERLRHYWMRDHAWVRAVLPNFYRVDADFYRANHPGARILGRAKALGVRSVLSLRGGGDSVPNRLERALCAKLGLELRFIGLSAVVLPGPDMLLDLVHQLRDVPKPVLVHCKSGADRTGLAATLYLHVLRGVPLAQARRQFHWTYAHFAWGRAGIVHLMLDAYADAHASDGIGFEDWVRSRYDPDALTDAFRTGRRRWRASK